VPWVRWIRGYYPDMGGHHRTVERFRKFDDLLDVFDALRIFSGIGQSVSAEVATDRRDFETGIREPGAQIREGCPAQFCEVGFSTGGIELNAVYAKFRRGLYSACQSKTKGFQHDSNFKHDNFHS